VHAGQFLGLDGDGSITAPTAVQPFRGRLIRLDEMSEAIRSDAAPGSGGGMYTRKAHETREAASSNRTGNARSSCWQRLQASWVDRLSALGARTICAFGYSL